jgi:hypothetical protein
MMSGAPVEQATLSILKASRLYYLVVVADQVTRSLSLEVDKRSGVEAQQEHQRTDK